MCNKIKKKVKKINFHPSLYPSIILKFFPPIAYSNQEVYNYYHDRPFPHSHPPSSPLSFHGNNQPTSSSYSSHPPRWCHHCYDSSHYSEQCPSIGYSLGLSQNQFDTFQGPMNEPYQSNFNYEG